MKQFLILFLSLLLPMCQEEAFAGNVTTYPSVSSVTGSDLLFDWQGGAQQSATAQQMKTYIGGPGTIFVANGKTYTLNNTLTFSGTDGSSVNFGAGGTVLYAAGIGSSIEAWNTKLDALAALAAPAASSYVLSSTTNGALSWVPQTGAASISIGSNASGVLTYSSTVLNLANLTNSASGLLQLDSTGNIPAGLLGNYIGSTVQTYNANLTSLAMTPPYTMGANLATTGTWPNLTISVTGLGSAAAESSSTFLGTTNNLSDLTSTSTARTNLGLGSLSTSNSITTSNITGLGSGIAIAAANTVNTTGSFPTVAGITLPTFYFAVRNDGKAGSGTSADPYDGSTAAHFDAAIASIFALSQPAKIVLGPGTYFTSTPTSVNGVDAFVLLYGGELQGAGEWSTTIALSSNVYTGTGDGRSGDIVYANDSPTYPEYVHDLTINGNMSGQSATNMACNCLIFGYANSIVERVGFEGYGETGLSGGEEFPVHLYAANDICKDCYFYQPSSSDTALTTVLAAGGNGTILSGNYFAPITVPAGGYHELGQSADSIVSINNYISGSTNSAISIAGWYADSNSYTNLKILNNTFLNCVGINLNSSTAYACSNILIAGNNWTTSRTGDHFFEANTAQNCTLRDNFINQGSCTGDLIQLSGNGPTYDTFSILNNIFKVNLSQGKAITQYSGNGNQVVECSGNYNSTSNNFLGVYDQYAPGDGGFDVADGFGVAASSLTTNTYLPYLTSGAPSAATSSEVQSVIGSGVYLGDTNNLADLSSASTARNNLGLGSLSTSNSVNNGNWSGAVLGTTNGGTGTNTITGWIYGNGTSPLGPAPDQNVALTDTTNIFSTNQTLDGTNNTLPNQVGIYPPAAATAMSYDQTVFQLLSGFRDWSAMFVNLAAPGASTTTNSGTVGYNSNFGGEVYTNNSTSTNSGGLGIYEYFSGAQNCTGTAGVRTFDFSKKITFVCHFFWEGTNACPNTICRCMFGKNQNGSSSLFGAPTVAAIGFKCTMGTANSATIYGEVNNGSTLNTSSALATLNSSNSSYIHTVIMRSNGSGTVTYYVDGVLEGTLTGAPTSVTTGNTDTFEIETYDTSDTTAVGNFFAQAPQLYFGL